MSIIGILKIMDVQEDVSKISLMTYRDTGDTDYAWQTFHTTQDAKTTIKPFSMPSGMLFFQNFR